MGPRRMVRPDFSLSPQKLAKMDKENIFAQMRGFQENGQNIKNPAVLCFLHF
jgi:hypothetical protein